MKKAAIIILLAATAASCKKTKCYTCTLKATSAGKTVATSSSTQCDLTEEDKKAIEQAGTQTATSGGVTVYQTMTCK